MVQLLASASHGNINYALRGNPATTAALYQLFAHRHHPQNPQNSEVDEAVQTNFIESLNDVQNLSDDNAFRALAELINAGVRSNAFLRNSGEPIAIKINPRLLSFAPAPLPHREIFIHGRHVQGVHLRGGPVARGGIRLSDRPADFRTEVLELMATQVVKNGMIIPTGAKGGFVVRGGDGSAFIQAQYRAFVRSLLSLTDNLSGTRVVPPKDMTIAAGDENDHYLVLAADKGTATFSDLANDEAASAGFWLDDAFASGGSNGYDHKVYGITARGAWVCVQHHFAQIGMDPNRDPISVVAIGDMGGDVFGNGMLQSKTQQLIGAFNHLHIFLDPNPDPAVSHRERQRLFDTRGGWDAYNSKLISPGGGVFPRAAKQIEIGQEAADALGISPGALSGEALVRALLQAPVDLLYNGGIGTYVRSSKERDDQVQDPANNQVRVSADTLRCKVIGEGGNLGLSQRARIEFAAMGGHINTDAIDNSGGVDMSDHEVNLKVLLAGGKNSPTRPQRNRLLASVGTEVAQQCLAGNLAQSRTLTLAAAECNTFPPRVRRLKDRLVSQGHIHPGFDPDMDEAGLSSLPLRPQLAVLTGHEKNRIKAALAAADFAQNTPFRDTLLRGYFPARVVHRHRNAITAHPLADEIINTATANRLVDGFGLFAASHLETLIGTGSAEVAQGLLAADYVLQAENLRLSIWRDSLEMEQAVTMQLALQSHLQHFAEELLRLAPVNDMSLDWLTEQRRHFTKFRHLIEGGEDRGADGEVCLIAPEALRAGLSEADCAWLCAMPHLARCGVALQAGIRLNMPLSRCLAANRATFKLLPLLTVEMQLRNPSWGTDLSHALRGEWLSRLTHMRSRAVNLLLRHRGRDLVSVGQRAWSAHRHWQNISEDTEYLSRPNADPMRVILLLTRMESLIDETDG
jgi:glutamate dehydrogenase